MPLRQTLLICAGCALSGVLGATVVLSLQRPATEPATSPALLAELRAIRQALERTGDRPAARPLPRAPDAPPPARPEPLQPEADAALLAAIAELRAAAQALAGAGPAAAAAGGEATAPETYAARVAALAERSPHSGETEAAELHAPPEYFLAGARHVLARLGPPDDTWSHGNGKDEWFYRLPGGERLVIAFVEGHCAWTYRR